MRKDAIIPTIRMIQMNVCAQCAETGGITFLALNPLIVNYFPYDSKNQK